MTKTNNELTLEDLARVLPPASTAHTAPVKRERCDGGPDVFGEFGPCKCNDCEEER